jgi:putative peptidoglycan lipid II flippase
MLGLTMMFSTEIFLKFFGSYLNRGAIAGLNFGLRIMLMLVAFFGQAVGVASFPYLARLAAEDKIADMVRLLDDSLRYLALVIPLAVCVMVLRREVVAVLFEHGRFDAAATEMTAGLLVYLLFGAFAFAAQTVVVRGFYALQNTLFPAIFSTVGVVLSLPFFIAGTYFMGAKGVALAISISATLQVFLLYGLWNRRVANPQGGQLIRFIGKVTLITIPLGVLCERLRIDLANFIGSDLAGSLTMIVVISVIFGAMFVAAAYAFNLREVRQVVGLLLNRQRR